MDKRAEERRLKRRHARAASVYNTVINSPRDFTAAPAISRVYKLHYRRVSPHPGPQNSESSTDWVRWNFGEPLNSRVKRLQYNNAITRIEKGWMVHPNIQGMYANVWTDIMCALAQRDGMELMHAKWLMTGGQS